MILECMQMFDLIRSDLLQLPDPVPARHPHRVEASWRIRIRVVVRDVPTTVGTWDTEIDQHLGKE